MVALIVVLTIVGCLVTDSIVLQMRKRRAATAGGRALEADLVFAQDGGEPVEGTENKEV